MQPGSRPIKLLFLLLALAVGATAAELPDIRSAPPDLATPPMLDAPPAADRRVKQTAPGWERTSVYHALYLPKDWHPGIRLPVLVEYAGNGGYSNRWGDISRGVPEGSNLGYGISGGSNFLWVCLPYVAVEDGRKTIATRWWGDVGETLRYATNTIRLLAERFGADTNALVLCGFSRGAIACNYLGLHNDAVAPLWRAFIAHSHYDGVRTGWPYAGADRASALTRLRRLDGRPQFISMETSTADIERHLAGTGVPGKFTFQPLPFRNHTDEWVLRDVPERRRLRAWLKAVLQPGKKAP